MRKVRRDGLVINDKVIIIDNKKRSSVFLSHIFQVVAILMGCFAFHSSFLEAIPLTNRTFEVMLFEVLWGVVIFSLCLWRKYDKLKFLTGSLGYLTFLAWKLPALKNGFYNLENIVLKRIGDYYGYLSVQFTVDYSRLERDSFLLMIMLMVPLIALLSIAVVRNRLVIWVNILLLLPVAATFLFGLEPLPANLISYVIITLYLGCAGNSRHYAMDRRQRTLLHRINSKAAVWLGLMTIVLFFFMKLFLSQDEYDGIVEINRTKARIQSFLFDFSWEDFVSIVTSYDWTMDGAAGGINGGKLGGVDRVEFDNSEQLEITTNYNGIKDGVYLKGYVGSVYTGHRWMGHSSAVDKLYDGLSQKWDRDPFLMVNDEFRLIGALTKSAYPNRVSADGSMITDYYTSKMNITYHAANRKYLYVPYYTEYNGMTNVGFMQDMYSTLESRRKNYSLYYYHYQSRTKAPLNNTAYRVHVTEGGATREFEEDYRQFVYQVYTHLPDEGVEQVIKEFAPLRLDKEYDSVFEKITYIRDYLKNHVDYSLEPGKTPWDKDFVEYFLYENKKGYCAHFASAATLMLRAMGVPARYVEGFAVSSKDVMKNMVTREETNSNLDGNLETNLIPDVNVLSSTNGGVEATFTPGEDIILIAGNENVTVSVKDYSAHSWVEVYMDGCGWIPIDFTPGSDMGISAASNIGQQANEAKEISPTPKAITPTPRAEDTRQEEDRRDDTTKEDKKEKNMDVTKIVTIVIIIWILGTGIGFISIRFIHRILRKRTKDPNLKAILLYEEMEKLLCRVKAVGLDKNRLLENNVAYVKEHCSYLQDDEFETIMEIVRRARFGRGTITSEELKQVNDFYVSLKEKIWGDLSFFRKMYLKLWLLF